MKAKKKKNKVHHVCACACVCVCVRVRACECVCVRVYHTQTHTHTHTRFESIRSIECEAAMILMFSNEQRHLHHVAIFFSGGETCSFCTCS